MKDHFWAHLTFKNVAEFKEKNANVLAVLPLASIEQHGLHLPLETDTAIIEGVVEHVLPHLESAEIYFLPTIKVGKSLEHKNFSGTLTLTSETLSKVIFETALSLNAAGVSKLVLLNSHGGNRAVIESTARDIRQNIGMQVGFAMWSGFVSKSTFFPDDLNILHDVHGGAFETSVMMYLKPNLVRADQIKNYAVKTIQVNEENMYVGYYNKPLQLAWGMQDIQAQGATGDATKASANIGKQIIDQASVAIAGALKEFLALELPSDIKK